MSAVQTIEKEQFYPILSSLPLLTAMWCVAVSEAEPSAAEG